MTNKYPLYAAIVAFAILAAAVLSLQTVHADIYNGTVLGSASTTAAIAVTTSQVVLATTTPNPINGGRYTRVYASICNPNANPVVLSLNSGTPASLSNATYIIAAAAGYSACYEITDRNMEQGAITASSTNQTSTTITVSDYVQ